MLLNWPTTEYALQYNTNLSLDLRKKIWQDNLKLRESCAENDRVDHFWVYQTRNGSKNKFAAKETNKNIHNLRVINGTQRNKLTYEDSQKVNFRLNQPTALKSALKTTSPATQHDEKTSSDQVELGSVLRTNNEASMAENEHEEETANPLNLKSNLEISSDSYDKLSKDVGIQTPCWQNNIRLVNSPPKITEPCFSNNLVYERLPKRISPSKIIVPLVEEKTPFAPYGWADSERSVGSKRTFNTNASALEVYPSALHALSSRRELRKQSRDSSRKRPSTAPLMSPVNHSSLWMTEYQDIFSRPQSAPFATTKAVRWQ